MAVVIDDRLLDCDTSQEVTENFNRTLAIADGIQGDLDTAEADIGTLETASAGHTASLAVIEAYLATVKVDVTFDSDGGSAVPKQTIGYGTAATEPEDPTKENYTFSHWELDEEEFNFATLVKKNITLTAIWTENTGE